MVRARRAGKPPVEDALFLAFETRNVCRLARRRRRGGFVGGARLVAAERERRLRNTVRAFEERKQRRVSESFVAATAAAAAVRFFRWRSFVRRKSMKRAREKELSALAEARAASSRVAKKRALLRRWFHVARKKKTKRDAATRIVNASNAFFAATKRRTAFLEWRRRCQDELSKRALFIARLDRDRAFRNGLQTFLAWRDERARPKTRRREVKIRARDFFQTTHVRKTWTAWRFDALSFLKKERADKRHVWGVLDALVQSARWRLGVAAAHFAAKTDTRKKSILKLWRDVARDSANEAAAETYARTVVRKRILRAVFSHAFANPSRDAFFARRADAHRHATTRGGVVARVALHDGARTQSRIKKKRASSFRGGTTSRENVRSLARSFSGTSAFETFGIAKARESRRDAFSAREVSRVHRLVLPLAGCRERQAAHFQRRGSFSKSVFDDARVLGLGFVHRGGTKRRTLCRTRSSRPLPRRYRRRLSAACSTPGWKTLKRRLRGV
jgi:hypothetical protein